ncbi:hypothetical protein SDC9_150388 [bioreactor metagenome]|uniref:Uncharacterized protein n=1 Tax=bioreactor metagenome TaxID=1076179 RepID=A0A645ERK7_9ZZZZ
MIPSPEQASHLPPLTLKLNRPFEYPRIFASFVCAYKSLIISNRPVYVAGFDLGVLPIGDWSIFITLSKFSSPRISSCIPGWHFALFKSLASLLYKISLTRELLPEPETPVIHVNTPSGILTSMFLRLFSEAPTTVRYCSPFLLFKGMSIFFLPLKFAPVSLFLQFLISSTDPAHTTFPPSLPAPGPISTI